MKKILFALLFLVPALTFGQAIAELGIVHGLHVGRTSTADSLHDFGVIDISDCDSIHIVLSVSDSARVAVLPAIVTPYKTSDTATAFAHPYQATTFTQVTAASIIVVPWHNILLTQEPNTTGARSIRLKVMLFLTGTETYSSASADKMWVYVKKFRRR